MASGDIMSAVYVGGTHSLIFTQACDSSPELGGSFMLQRGLFGAVAVWAGTWLCNMIPAMPKTCLCRAMCTFAVLEMHRQSRLLPFDLPVGECDVQQYNITLALWQYLSPSILKGWIC